MRTDLKTKTALSLQQRLEALTERLAGANKKSRGGLSAAAVDKLELQRLVHELQVHQIELEMQNRELRAAQAELELSRDLFADLYDFAPVGYMDMDANGIIRNINTTGTDLLGEVRSAIIGKPFGVYLRGANRHRFAESLRACQQTAERQVLELELRSKTNPTLPVEVTMVQAAVSQNHQSVCRATLSDITERRRAEAEKAELLQREQAARSAAEADRDFIRHVLTHAPMIIGFLEGPEHRLKWLNDAGLEATRLSKASLERPLKKVLPNLHAQIRDFLDHVYTASNPVTTLEIVLEFADQPPKWFQIALAPLAAEAELAAPLATWYTNVKGVVFMAVDITERKQAFVALRKSEESLETRVKERTTELAHAIGSLREEVAERKHAQDARQQLFRELATIQEDERRHIARELHDQMGQHLTALSIGLKNLEARIRQRSASPLHRAEWEASSEAGSSSHPALQQLRDLQKLTDKIGIEIHHIASELRPTALDDLGLQATLANYLEEWSARFGLPVDFHPDAAGKERLPAEIETTVYRIVQEALTNVVKHAQASHLSLILSRIEGHLVTIIEDNGKGFDPEHVPAAGSDQPRLGLAGIRERVMLAGGTFQIESKPGQGTTLFVRIPLPGNGKAQPRKPRKQPKVVPDEKQISNR